MALTDLIKTAGKVLRASALGLAVQGCGGNGSSKCEPLCHHVWIDCSGLPNANYWFGKSYDNCLQGCPEFLEGVNKSPYAHGMNNAIDCVINTDDCKLLELDYCEMDECDLFSNYSPNRDWNKESPGCE